MGEVCRLDRALDRVGAGEVARGPRLVTSIGAPSSACARDAECHRGDPGRVEALHSKSIEAAALAAQRLV